MMQFFTLLLIATLSSASAWGDCGKNSVEVPFNFKNDVTCYRELGPFSINLESVTNERIAHFLVALYETEHENIPHASTVQYLNIDQDNNLQILSFLCSGETPVISDAYSANLKDLVEDRHSGGSGAVFISTGQAAENISVGQRKKLKAKIYDKFIELYELAGANFTRIDDDNSNVYIPNVLLMQDPRRLSKTERQIYSNYFSQTGSSINACSKKFKRTMSDFLIKNILRAQSFNEIEIKRNKDSQKLEIFWEF